MMGSNYQAEVSLKMQLPCDGFQLKLEGRADGILLESEKTIIDEIKGVVRSLDRVEHPVPVHLAQAKCYAYIYARQQGLKQISVQMTYCNLDTEDVKRFREEYTFEELEKWFLDLVHQYERWANCRLSGKREEMLRFIRPNFHSHIEKGSLTWQLPYIVQFITKRNYLSKPQQEPERRWQYCIRR